MSPVASPPALVDFEPCRACPFLSCPFHGCQRDVDRRASDRARGRHKPVAP